MNLHRVNGTADWVSVPAGHRNVWQRLAASSGGVLTPGNFISVLGLISTPIALWLIVTYHLYIAGVLLLAAGRLCDLADGWLADKTGTKSPLGEKLDATADKFVTGLAVVVLIAAGTVPWWLVVPVIMPHAVIAVIALLAYRRGQGLHPSRPGKFSMAFIWAALLVFTFGKGYQYSPQIVLLSVLFVVTIICAAAATVLGFWALSGYVQDYRRNTSQAK